MMKILYSPQARLGDEQIKYSFTNEKVIVESNGYSEEFDFSDMPNGVADAVESEIFSFNPIISAERVNGELKLVLLNLIGEDATHEECFPEWIEVKTDGKNNMEK